MAPWNGSAPNQTFGRTDGVRTGATTWVDADGAGVDIIASAHDIHDQDEADGINACLKKDGGNTASANLPMGGFIHTNVGDATAQTHYMNLKQHVNCVGQYCATVGGTANAITLTTGMSFTTLAAGATFSFICAATNTSATVTITVDSVAAKTVKVGASSPSVGQMVISTMIIVQYDGTNLQLISSGTAPTAIPVGSILAWPTSTVPTGLLALDGSAVSRTTYAALFTVYGTTYGVGDGSTTFNLPNYVGRFLRGYDSGTSVDVDSASRTDRGDGTTGANVGTKQSYAVQAHTHAAGTLAADSNGAHTHTYTRSDTGGNANSGGASGISQSTQTTSSNGAHTHTISGSTASTGASTETRPINTTVIWVCVALPGAALAVSTTLSSVVIITAAGTASVAPLTMTAGTNLTTAAAGAVEFDGKCFYDTAAASSRQVRRDEQIIVLTADYTLTDSATAQKAFNSPTNGTLAVQASTTYMFDFEYTITNTGTTSHTWGVLIALTTATLTSGNMVVKGRSGTTSAATLTAEASAYTTDVTTVLVSTAASTSSTENVILSGRGVLRINAAGSITPQVKLSAQPNGTEKMLANSWFRLYPIGSNTVASVGNWS